MMQRHSLMCTAMHPPEVVQQVVRAQSQQVLRVLVKVGAKLAGRRQLHSVGAAAKRAVRQGAWMPAAAAVAK